MSEQQEDYDSPWKEALERYFPEFMAFFFPFAHVDIDWGRGYNFLDKELQQVVREAALGPRRVDKLVQVWRPDGEETWVLIHVKIQGQVDPDFARRMYVYNYRLFDRYARQVASMAILTDERAGWRPAEFSYTLWNCRVSLEFPVVKLLDYAADWTALEQNNNPFAVVVMAHLKAQATNRKPNDRYLWKMNLAKGLYQRGYKRRDILELFRFIDWVMALPKELAQQFEVELAQYEQETKMTYVTSFERIGMERGIRQTAREDLADVLQIRFPEVPGSILETIGRVEDVAVLKGLLRQAVTADSLETFQRVLNEVTRPTPVSAN